MHIALTAVTVLYGGVFVVSGTGQLAGRGPLRTPAAACGFSPVACQGIGALELMGGAGLLTAGYLMVAGAVAAAGLFLLTAAAFLYHDGQEDRGLRLWAPAVTAAVMLCVAVALPLTGVG
ncbi:DoxX family protein [Streptomyces sp. ME03-5684b]|uniref:DoxX family protein n=1 Tax=Streptomyces sp. ME03-5684b TaxID=3028681 RepID=UPI0029B43676|nr:DoxX family protein [Streptomyces sp. ME03-5684b]MDX3319727.1 DoxX family protein [Streptomyces sp. ME03-5684b]